MQTSNVGSPEEVYPTSGNDGKVKQDVRQFAGEVDRLAGEAKQLSSEGAALARAKLDDTVSQAKAKLAPRVTQRPSKAGVPSPRLKVTCTSIRLPRSLPRSRSAWSWAC